ncbi:MAG: hypothetical protein CMJ77_20895 [Planctomycetaceae bacterium]|nr:hypothetical protein [Planctomycetaceae bacterium]
MKIYPEQQQESFNARRPDRTSNPSFRHECTLPVHLNDHNQNREKKRILSSFETDSVNSFPKTAMPL